LPAAILVLLWFCNARMALTVLPFVLVVGAVIPLLTQQFTRPAARDTRQHTAALTAGFTDSIQGVREILVFNWEHHQEDEIVALNRQLAGAQGRLAAAGAWQSGLSDFFIGAGIAAALLAGTMAVQGGEMSGWTFPPAMALALCIFLPLLGISNLIPDLDRALGSAGRIFEILDKPEPPDGGTEGLPAAGPTGVELQNVVFSYPGETEPVLRGVSLSLPPGKITAVVGESGAGKSTLVSLLLGFWTPQQGTIRIGPTDARFLAREAMREVFAVAPQRGHLFNTTLRENLLLARPAASAEDIESAARLAGIHDFIVSLPKGYDTPAQEAGQRFSGGQRQRLALARAFLKNAPVLILDEATAGLDLKTEAAILDNLRQWIDADPSRSALVITHRILGASKADSIAVLQSGKIVETGTHEELLERQGTYSALFRAQIETV
jgi:ATP-binding cassette subfamily C protein CydC